MSERLPVGSALVTGATRGIGRRVAERLAEEGVRTWGLGRSAAVLADLSRERGVEPVVADLSDDASVWTSLEALQEGNGGPPDLVVNAAGVFGVAACSEETVLRFDEQLAVNLRGTFLVNRALLPSMLERGSGTIVNVGSVAGHRAFPGNAAYSASKFGLRGYHDVLVEELRGTGVRTCLVEPAATDTTLWDPLDPDSDPGLPNRADMLTADQVADAILFVATRPAGVSVPLLRIERG